MLFKRECVASGNSRASFVHIRLGPSKVISLDRHPLGNHLLYCIFDGREFAFGDPGFQPLLLGRRDDDVHSQNIVRPDDPGQHVNMKAKRPAGDPPGA